MTIEALPSPRNYQNLDNIAEYRPTLDELMAGKVNKKEDAEAPPAEDKRKGKVSVVYLLVLNHATKYCSINTFFL